MKSPSSFLPLSLSLTASFIAGSVAALLISRHPTTNPSSVTPGPPASESASADPTVSSSPLQARAIPPHSIQAEPTATTVTSTPAPDPAGEPMASRNDESLARRNDWRQRLDQLTALHNDPAKALEQWSGELLTAYRTTLDPLIDSIQYQTATDRYDALAALSDSTQSGASRLLREIGLDESSTREFLDQALAGVRAEEQYAEVDGSPTLRRALYELDQERLARVTEIHQLLEDHDQAVARIQVEVDPWYEQRLLAIQRSDVVIQAGL